MRGLSTPILSVYHTAVYGLHRSQLGLQYHRLIGHRRAHVTAQEYGVEAIHLSWKDDSPTGGSVVLESSKLPSRVRWLNLSVRRRCMCGVLVDREYLKVYGTDWVALTSVSRRPLGGQWHLAISQVLRSILGRNDGRSRRLTRA